MKWFKTDTYIHIEENLQGISLCFVNIPQSDQLHQMQ